MPLWLYLAVLTLLVPLGFLLNAGLLWATGKLFRVRRMSFRLAVVALAIGLALAIASGVARLVGLLPGLDVLLALAIPVTVVVLVHRRGDVGWWRAIATSVVFMIVVNICAIPEIWVLRRTISDAYVLPTGSMEPTLLAGDRFVADRTLVARRWDVVVYRSPRDGRTVYVKRLVGLPGETIEIIDGRVHVNSSAPAMPADLDGVRYESRQHPRMPPLRGVEGSPMTLAPDEFFVLGDNSAASEDSRHTPAVPGYQPGAVPRSYLLGVVRVVYWPWVRVRTFR